MVPNAEAFIHKPFSPDFTPENFYVSYFQFFLEMWNDC